jgi:hypothetical protein
VSEKTYKHHIQIFAKCIKKKCRSQEEEKLRKVAAALGVTPEGLKSFSEESIFYEHEIGRTIERYEKLLDQMKREEK